jgi:hypothetical protein
MSANELERGIRTDISHGQTLNDKLKKIHQYVSQGGDCTDMNIFQMIFSMDNTVPRPSQICKEGDPDDQR